MTEVYVVVAGMYYDRPYDVSIKVFDEEEKAKPYQTFLLEKEGYDYAHIYKKTVIS